MSSKQYNFLYKTTNLINNKFYYGIHRTDNLDDGYLGSGLLIKQAIAKYGKIFFKREIIEFFDTEEELLLCEQRLVNNNLIQQDDVYNLVPGGHAPLSGDHDKFWSSPDGQVVKHHLSEHNRGYKNPSFIKLWQPKFDTAKELFIRLVSRTNLPDDFISRQIAKYYGFDLKFHRQLRYYAANGDLENISAPIKIHDYFTSSGRINTFIKTPADSRCSQPYCLYKYLNLAYISNYSRFMSINQDTSISDSMLYNNEIPEIPDARILYRSAAKYYQYLGLIQEVDKIHVNIRQRHPCAHRATGIKTIYAPVDTYIQQYTCIKDSIDERYNIHFDGETISISRI